MCVYIGIIMFRIIAEVGNVDESSKPTQHITCQLVESFTLLFRSYPYSVKEKNMPNMPSISTHHYGTIKFPNANSVILVFLQQC